MRGWRESLYALNQAGFDVLAYDRRGEGLSGGFSDTNTLEQGEDIFRVLAQIETGRGLRLLAAWPAAGRSGCRGQADGRAARARDPAAAARQFARIDGHRLGHDQELRRPLQLRPAAGRMRGAKGLPNISGAICSPRSSAAQVIFPRPRPRRPQSVPGRHGGREPRRLLSEFGSARRHGSAGRQRSSPKGCGTGPRAWRERRRLRPGQRAEGDRRGPRAALDGDVAAAGARRVRDRMVGFARAAVQGRTQLSDVPSWTNIKESWAQRLTCGSPLSRSEQERIRRYPHQVID